MKSTERLEDFFASMMIWSNWQNTRGQKQRRKKNDKKTKFISEKKLIII
jgi:hypothetical protein